jgi:hypothetical protein
VGKSTLKLVGVYEAWSRSVRQGRLTRANGTEAPVLVRVFEERPATPELLARLREDVRLLGRLQHESVLRLEHVSAVGGKVGQVTEGFECASAARVLRVLRARNQVLPARAAVEAAAAVGLALDEALRIVDGDRAVAHPGPVPEEVLLDVAGRVKLAGFVVTRPDDPPLVLPKGYAAPEGGGSAAAATYMVGALLVELLSGESPPDAAADAERHEASIRRALIRVLARPGDTPGEPVVAVIRQALAHDPTARGGPGALGRKLRELAVALQSPGLRAWAPGSIPSIQKFVPTAAESRGGAALPQLPQPTDEASRAAPLGANMTIAPPAGPPAPLSAGLTIAPPDPKSREPLPDAVSRAHPRGQATIVPADSEDDAVLPEEAFGPSPRAAGAPRPDSVKFVPSPGPSGAPARDATPTRSAAGPSAAPRSSAAGAAAPRSSAAGAAPPGRVVSGASPAPLPAPGGTSPLPSPDASSGVGLSARETARSGVTPTGPLRPAGPAAGPSPSGPSLGGPSLGAPPAGTPPRPVVIAEAPVTRPVALEPGPRPAGPPAGPGPAVAAPRRGGLDIASGPSLDHLSEADDFEATVVAGMRPSGPAAPPIDPLAPGISAGPAPAGPASGRGAGSILDDEPESPRRSGFLLPLVMGVGVLGVLAVLVLGAGWYAFRPAPTEVAAPADIVAPLPEPTAPAGSLPAAPESAGAAPGAGTPAGAPAGAVAAPGSDTPAAVPAPAGPAPTVGAPVAPAPTAPAPVAAAPAPAPAAPAPSASAAPAHSAPPPTPSAPAHASTTASTSRTASTTAPAHTAPPATHTDEDDAPVRIAAAPPAPAPAPAPVATAPAPAADSPPAAPAFFRVEFTAGDPSITTLEVKCAQGAGSGSGSVVIEQAPKGNCRITGRGGDAPLITMVTVVADRSYTCFGGRSPSCK